MEKHSRKQCIAIIEHCIMTEVGLRHLLNSTQEGNCTFHYFRSIASFKQALRQTQFDTVVCSLSGSREMRIECLFTMGEIAHRYPEMIRIILANDKAEVELIKQLSPIYIHGVLNKSSELACLRQSILALFMEAEGQKGTDASIQQSDSHFLSPTENMILRYMTYGYSLMDIAEQLGRNIKTIRAHKFNAMTKLGVNSDVDLLCAADLLVSLPDRNIACTQSLRHSA